MIKYNAIAAVDHDRGRSIPLKQSLLDREGRRRSLGASQHERLQALILDEAIREESRQFQQALRPIAFPAIDPPLDVDRPEQLLDRPTRIGGAEQQVPAVA